MNSPYLIEHFGQIDERYILEAEPPEKVESRAKRWSMIAALAACIALAVIVTTVFKGQLALPSNPDVPIETNGVGCEVVEKLPTLTGDEDYLLEALDKYPEYYIYGVYLGETMTDVIADFGEPDNIVGGLDHEGLLCNYDDFSVYCVPTTIGWQINMIVSSPYTSEIPFGWQLETTTWQDILSQISDDENISYSERLRGNPTQALIRLNQGSIQLGLNLVQEVEKPSNMATRVLEEIWFEYDESCYNVHQ